MLWRFSFRPWISWPGCCENMDYQARCYECSESCVLSLILFLVFMDKILRCSRGQGCVQLGGFSNFCRWCGFVSLIRQWLSARIGKVLTWVGWKSTPPETGVCLLLPQDREFKYLGVLFMSYGNGQMFRATSVLGLSCMAKCLVYRSVFDLTLTYGHELWVVTNKTHIHRSKCSKCGSFLQRVSGA